MRIPKDWVFVFPIDKLEGLVAIVKKNLCEDSNSAEHNMMLTLMVPAYVVQGPPMLEAPIDCLVPHPCHAHCFQVISILCLVRSATGKLTLISFITHHVLTWQEHLP